MKDKTKSGRCTKIAFGVTSVVVAAMGLYVFAGQQDEPGTPAESGLAALSPATTAAATVATTGKAFEGSMVTTMANAVDNAASRPVVEVWKSPTCGCCKGWVAYLEDSGFEVTAHDVEDVDPFRAELGLTDASLKSCHTALIDGYVVEGHVPVSDIDKLLAERPDVVGISAPGMPMLSPGMGSIEPRDYDVVSFNATQNIEIYSNH